MTTSFKIATPISRLFDEQQMAEKIIIASDCLECRDESLRSAWPDQELYHSDLQPILVWEESDFEQLRLIKELKSQLKLISFHAAVSCSAPRLVNGMFEPGGKLLSVDEMLSNTATNVSRIRDIFGSEIIIAVENNNYYPTKAYEHIADPDFLTQVVKDNNLSLLLDLAHVKISAKNLGLDQEAYVSRLPLGHVIQLHVSSVMERSGPIYYDDHELPLAPEFDQVVRFLSRSPIQYVSVEYYKEASGLLKALDQLRRLK